MFVFIYISLIGIMSGTRNSHFPASRSMHSCEAPSLIWSSCIVSQFPLKIHSIIPKYHCKNPFAVTIICSDFNPFGWFQRTWNIVCVWCLISHVRLVTTYVIL